MVPIHALFRVALNRALFLGTGLPANGRFVPHRVDLLVNRRKGPLDDRRVLRNNRSLVLSRITRPPTRVVSSLAALFGAVGSIGHTFVYSVGRGRRTRPGLLVNVRTSNSVRRVVRTAKDMTASALPNSRPVSVYRIGGKRGKVDRFVARRVIPFCRHH